MRFWAEVNTSTIGLNQKEYSKKYRWYPYNKGGGYRKWYGYNEYLIDWLDEGLEIKNIPTAVVANEKFFFSPGLTWSTITSSRFSIRLFENGYIFDNGGCCLFSDLEHRYYYLALMNSIIFEAMLGKINPTLNFQSGEVSKFPVLNNKEITVLVMKELEEENNRLLIGVYVVFPH